MRTDTPKTIYLKDYKPFPFEIESLNLDFDIHDGETFVTAITKYKKKDPATKEDLFLYGEELEIEEITLNDEPLEGYTTDDKSMTIPAP